ERVAVLHRAAAAAALVAAADPARLGRREVAAGDRAHAAERLRRPLDLAGGGEARQAHRPGAGRPEQEGGQEARGAARGGQGRPGAAHRAAQRNGRRAAGADARAPRAVTGYSRGMLLALLLAATQLPAYTDYVVDKAGVLGAVEDQDRKSTRLNSSHRTIS